MTEKIRVVFKDPMWCVICPKHGEDCYPTQAEAEYAAEEHAKSDGLEWQKA